LQDDGVMLRNPLINDLHVRRFFLVGVASLVACQGTIGEPPEPLAPPPPNVTPKDVPVSPTVVEATSYCTTIADGESLASVSPEGHAWMTSRAGEEATTLRVLDPRGEGSELIDEVILTEVTAVHAYTEGDAGLVAQGGLWRLDQMARIELQAPDGFAAPAQLCGDPSLNGAMLSQGTLFEHRADDQWWSWTPDVDESQRPEALLGFDGECIGPDNVMWLTGADGSLWRVESSRVTFPINFAGLRAAVASGELVAAIDGERLWVGPDSWQPWVFSGAAPTQLSAADGKVWMASGDQLLRFDGEAFVEIEHDMNGIERIEAHAGGAWVQAGDQLCHLAPSEMIRVSGVRPYARLNEDDVGFSVAVIEGIELMASLDGEPVTVSPDAENPGWLSVRGSIETSGWHTFTLAAGDAERRLTVKREPAEQRSWASDVEPLYQSNCTGTVCHGTNETIPDLGTYDAWVDNAAKIQNRVVHEQDMPPETNRGPNWSEDEKIVAQWLEGGMLP